MDKRWRVGSLLEYLVYRVRKFILGTGRNMCILGVYTSALFTLFGFLATVACLCADGLQYTGLLFLAPFTLLLGFGTWSMYKAALWAEESSDKMEPILPPTRQNIEQLPASEMLLRGSEEPTLGQEKVLLRASIATEETHPEELLRPHL